MYKSKQLTNEESIKIITGNGRYDRSCLGAINGVTSVIVYLAKNNSRKVKKLLYSTLQISEVFRRPTSKKREEKGRKEQGEDGVHGAGENSPLLWEYGCYTDSGVDRGGRAERAEAPPQKMFNSFFAAVVVNCQKILNSSCERHA